MDRPPLISFIVSVYDRSWSLNACLASLRVQHDLSQSVVCCNSTIQKDMDAIKDLCGHYSIGFMSTGFDAGNCYDSVNAAVKTVCGEWLCFPSDDSLYVADFSKMMLATAEREKADFVYCDCVYKQGSISGNWPPYSVLETQPKIGRIDKTTFILKRDKFHGFPPHPHDYRDGALAEELVRGGVRHAKAPGVLAIHQ